MAEQSGTDERDAKPRYYYDTTSVQETESRSFRQVADEVAREGLLTLGLGTSCFVGEAAYQDIAEQRFSARLPHTENTPTPSAGSLATLSVQVNLRDAE